MNKKFIAKIGSIITAIIVTVATPMAALADTGGGIGGGGSNQTLTGPIHWASIAYDEPGKAYKDFLKRAGWDKNTVESQVVGRVKNSKVCPASRVIWYINHNATNKWVFNYGYTGTHGSSWNNHHNASGTIENPHKKYGARAATSAEVAAFKKWDKNHNGNKINKKPGYTIICSGQYEIPEEKWVVTETEGGKSTQHSLVYNEPYAYTTEIKPQSIEGKIDPIGEPNLHAQKGPSVRTNYGKLWDQVNSGKLKLSPSKLDARVQAALKKDKSLSHGTVTLDAKNKEGMAEGGVLNVYEQTQYARLSSTQITDTVKKFKCTYTRTWNYNTQKWNAATKTCKQTGTSPSGITITMKSTVGTSENTGFWQMISVHCNYEDFKALLDSDKTIKAVSGGSGTEGKASSLTNGTISASAVTQRYKKAPSAAELDFGSATNANAAKAATGKLAFYDKECGFECTSENIGSTAQANKATSNVNSSGNIQEGERTGVSATSNGTKVNSNNLEFFRDNDKNRITTDLWYPKRTTNVLYDGEDPVTTTVSRWSEGTPGITSSNGGKFTMVSVDKNGGQLFTGKDKAKTQKNWDSTTFSNSQSTILTGRHQNFDVSSTWASEKNRPQVLNVKYEYEPQVVSGIYANNIGFGVNGAQRTGGIAKPSTTIQGKCYVNYKKPGVSEKQHSTTKLFHDNTGTGTKNEIDGKIIEGAGSIQESKDKKTNLVVNFVRSTTE